MGSILLGLAAGTRELEPVGTLSAQPHLEQPVFEPEERQTGELERTYLRVFDALAEMILRRQGRVRD